MAHRPRFYLPLAALLFNLGTPVFAMRIGEMDVISNMGAPLHARIAIAADDEASLRDECFRLVGPDSHHGPLNEARLELVASGGKRYIDIRTRTPVSDPILDLTLRTEGCGPTIQKDFVILLSPKEVTAEAVAPPLATLPASVPMAAANPVPSAHPRSAAPRPKIPFQQRHPAPHSWQRAAPVEHRRQQIPNQPGHLSLRLDYGFGSLARFTEQVAQRRQQIQNNAAAKPAPAPPVKPLPGAEPRGQSVQLGQGDKLVLQPTRQNTIPSLPAYPSTPPGGQTDRVAARPQATTGNNQVELARPGITGRVPAPEANHPTRLWGRWLSSSYPLILLTLVLVALVALWLKRRTPPASRFLDKTAPGLDTLVPADPDNPQHHPLLAHNMPALDHAFAEPTETKTLLAETFEPKAAEAKTAMIKSLTDDLELAPTAMPMSDFTVEQFDSTDQALELAEVMLAFGRSSQAIDTLSQYIRKNPDQAITPWLKLLDLYFQSKLRNEFDALAMDLHRHFNVTIAEWSDYERTKGLPAEDASLTLESLPHIMDRLTANWGTPAGLNYLDKLLADNRGGQRHGFSLPLVRDILLLRDILRQTSAAPTPIH